MAIRAEHIVLLSNADMWICLHTNGLDPDWIAVPLIILGHRPRTGQRIVDGGDFVMQNVGIGTVEINPLLHIGLIVAVQRNATWVERTRTFHVASLNLKEVILTAPGLVDPFSNRIAHE